MLHALMTGATIVLAARRAPANTDVVVLSDGRSVGMGGVGVALNETGSAPFQNPAGLGAVRSFTGTATFTPVVSRVWAPFPDPVTGQPATRTSTTVLAPLGLLGAGVRVHERVVIGLTAFLTAGSGAEFRGAVPGYETKVLAVAGEAQIPVAINVTDRLSLGAAYRITAGELQSNLPVSPAPGAPPIATSTTLSGVDGKGFVLGARYRLTDHVKLGVAYRNEVTVNVSGQAKSGDIPLPGGDVHQQVSLPHTFKLGGAFSLLGDRLTLAADVMYWLYSDSHPADATAGRPEAWKNAILGLAGAEYLLTSRVPLRIGGNVGSSATSDGSASPFVPAPGVNIGATVGSGIRFDQFDVDYAAGYAAQLGKTIASGPTAGTYGGASVMFCASVTYRL
jgi:long-subunit fatty acid transport protein